MRVHRFLCLAALGLGLTLPALAVHETTTVYTLSNEKEGNRVLMFHVGSDGALAPAGSIPTGGLGSGVALGSQGALAISRNERWLLAVNAGSHSLSLFELTGDGPQLRDVVPSGGRNPISVALSDHAVAVLNAGGAVGGIDEIALFVIGPHGRLLAPRDATRRLSGPNVGPAQIAFALDGTVVVVTEKMTNKITTFVVGEDGRVSAPRVNPSQGPTPFGFAVVDDSELVVSEAAGGAPGASSASSYDIEANGTVIPITSALHTGQTAACWTATSRDGLAYLTNAGSSTVTRLAVARDGVLAVLDGNAGMTGSGSAPIDLAFSGDQQLLFVLSHATNTITAFSLDPHGALSSRGDVGGIPPASAGLVTR